MAVTVGVLSDTRRRTLEAVCDTFAPSLQVDEETDETLREFYARSASDLGVPAQIEGLLAQTALPEEIEALGQLLDGFAAQDFAGLPLPARTELIHAIAASSPEALVTGPGNQANTLTDFLSGAGGKTINFAVPGVGTGSHIEAEYFFEFLAKTPAQMIPFQGGAPAINATIGNQVDLMATTLGGGAAAQIEGGKLKGLGIAADKRAAVTPNVPTYAEQGFPGFSAASWVGFFAPAKTDPQVLATLNGAINAIVQTPEVQKKLTDMGFDPITGSPAQAETMFKAEVNKWGNMVKALNLSIK
jgi:tripartite-type tricarboxylate transporter receptor subunit TctC